MMEELVFVLGIPAVFILICLTFIILNNCYIWHYKRKANNGKITHNVSVVNISNIAKNTPSSPTWKRKSRKGLKILKCIRGINQVDKGKRMSLDPAFYPSSVIVLHDSEPPPSYQSLFDNPNSFKQNRSQGGQQSPNHWLHPNSAYQGTYPPPINTESAVLYL